MLRSAGIDSVFRNSHSIQPSTSFCNIVFFAAHVHTRLLRDQYSGADDNCSDPGAAGDFHASCELHPDDSFDNYT